MYFFESFLLIIILLINQNVLAQIYVPPLDFEMLLSGTFGELRSNHFHAGIDIKTEGVEGQKVRAIANGYVSRIKVSTWGYGKVIYITHPQTGHTSVYAHLKKFSSKINDFVKKEHYKKERFEINFFPNKDALLITQGEIIALSGNSGGSSGAHLHFEIRDTKSERPINPLQFGFKIYDDITPILRNLKVYAFDTTLINGYNKSKIYTISKRNNTHTINETPTINGNFALGIFTYDKSNNAYNKNGVYSIKLSIDSNTHYEFKADELDFNTTRYINAHIDYCEKQESKNKYHRCYKLPNNKLKNYSNLINNGIINFNDTLTHQINIEVSDFYNNTSNIRFQVKSTNDPFLMRCPLPKDTITTSFKLKKPNMFNATDFKLYMHPNSLYEPLKFRYNTTDSVEGVFGLVHHVHNNTVPVHKKYTLSIKANVPDKLISKTYIATTNMKGNFWYIGGDWVNGFLKTKTREFGDFCIIADTTKPEIRGLNIFPGKKFNTQTTIKLKIKDKESGIKSYRGEIDGKWILMDYDYKNNLLRFDIEQNISKGEHTFTLKVVDNIGNVSNYSAEFTY
ncbi:MAG: M23 family metallopeptidase [Bacteroidota bacterium]|nr:M23 family metallopeptidase [Bacteroidota bacterium]